MIGFLRRLVGRGRGVERPGESGIDPDELERRLDRVEDTLDRADGIARARPKPKEPSRPWWRWRGGSDG